MALTINNPEIERLVRELAEKTGLTEEQALESAVRLRLLEKQGIPRDPFVEEIRERALKEPLPDSRKVKAAVDAAQKYIASLPVLNTGTPDELVGYDEYGLPR